MAFGFHVGKEMFRLTLTGLVAGLDFVDDVDAAFAADDLASRVTLLRGFDGGYNFHKGTKTQFGLPPVNGKYCPEKVASAGR
jgi:hypothetical protein